MKRSEAVLLIARFLRELKDGSDPEIFGVTIEDMVEGDMLLTKLERRGMRPPATDFIMEYKKPEHVDVVISVLNALSWEKELSRDDE